MTIPIEEYNALKRTKNLLCRIIHMNLTQIRKNAKELREESRRCLRHYPFDVHLIEMYADRIEKNKMPMWESDIKRLRRDL